MILNKNVKGPGATTKEVKRIKIENHHGVIKAKLNCPKILFR